MRDKECPKCGGSTFVEGFILEKTHHHQTESTVWVEGKPEKNFWLGVKTRGREKAVVVAQRCARCGYLELYAPPAPPQA